MNRYVRLMCKHLYSRTLKIRTPLIFRHRLDLLKYKNYLQQKYLRKNNNQITTITITSLEVFFTFLDNMTKMSQLRQILTNIILILNYRGLW